MKMKRYFAMFLATLMLLASMSVGVFASSVEGSTEGEAAITVSTEMSEVSEVDTAGNHFFTGDFETVQGHFFGGFGTGNELLVQASEYEDVLALAGKTINVKTTKLGSSMFAAGYEVTLENDQVSGNVAAAGRNISMDQTSTAKAFFAAGQNVDFYGSVKALHIAAATACIDGKVDGDAEVVAEKVIIGENAQITGTLKVKSEVEPEIPSSASIGKMEFTKSGPEKPVVDPGEKAGLKEKALALLMESIFYIGTFLIVAIALSIFFPKHLEEAATMLKRRMLAMLGFGLFGLIVIPFLSILLMITGFGALLGGVSLGFYVCFLAISLAFTAASFFRMIPKIPGFILSIFGALVFAILMNVPYVNAIIGVFSALYMMGYVVVHTFDRRKGRTGLEEDDDDDDEDDNDDEDEYLLPAEKTEVVNTPAPVKPSIADVVVEDVVEEEPAIEEADHITVEFEGLEEE